MRTNIDLAAFLSFLFLVSVWCCACQSSTRPWTDQQKQELAKTCAEMKAINGLDFSLTGFDSSEIDTIWMRRLRGGRVIDSQKILPAWNTVDPIRRRYLANVAGTLYLDDVYEFLIPGYPPFKLSDMRTVVWSQFSGGEANYTCVMADYRINGQRFENANPDFVKPEALRKTKSDPKKIGE